MRLRRSCAVVLVILGAVAWTTSSRAQEPTWQAVNTGIPSYAWGRDVWSLAVSGSTLYAGTYHDAGGVVFRSDNNGDSWVQVGDPLPDVRTIAKAVAVAGTTVFAGVDGNPGGGIGGVYRLLDATTVWQPSGPVMLNYVTTFAQVGGTLFAGGAYGVYRTSNGGDTWESVLSDGAYSLAVSGGTLYVGTAGSGVKRSDDLGATWAPVGTGLTYVVRALAVSGTTVLAGSDTNGVYRLPAGETTWQASSTGLTDLYSRSFAQVGTSIFLGTASGGVFRSDNDGVSWQPFNTGLTNPMVRTLAVSGTTLYAGTAGGGVFRLSVTAPPSISATSITPTAAVRGWTFPVTIAGSGLSGVTHIRLHRTTPTVADLSFPVTSATASSVVATFNLEGLAPDWVGVHAIHYSTDGSTYSPTGLTFSINFSSPGFHTGVPISGVRGETVTVTITGSGLIDITHLRLHNATASLDLTFPAVAAPDSASVTAAFDLSGLGPEWDGTHQIQYSIGGTSFEDAPGWMFTVNSPPAPIHQNWTATLRLTGDEAGDHTVIVGVAPDASDGVNLSAEDTLAPPMPQPPASWLRLLRGGQALSQDVLAFADARTWTIEVEVGSGTHYLSVEGLPEGVLAYYNDNPRIVHGPDTDATTAAVHPLPLGASISLNTGRHLLTLVLSKRLPQTLATTLGIRWRMFSLPGPTTNGAPADLVTRGVISMYGYNPSPEVQNYYSMFGDADDQVSGVQVSDDPLPFVSQGWFIFRDPAASPLATTFQVDVGDPAAQSVSVTLQPRWNLVGVPFGGASASAYNPTAKTVFGYDGVNYVIATSLAQFQGYWVYNELATARTVTITQPSPGAPAIVQRAAPSPDWVAPLTISLDSGALKTVELGSGSKAQMGFDAYDVGLPPAPPIRSYSEFFAATDDPVERMTRSVLPSSQREASWELSANLAEAGTLRWTAQTLPAGYRIIVESGDERHDLSREGSMRLDAGKHTFTARLTFAPPSRSRLMANYPNPFNPETWIPFELKEGSAVTVNIYDVAGSLVRKLDLGYREPGYYTSRADAAYWDGRNELGERVASGVYFYELRAGSFRETRRMVIHK